jgi:hypothetical protein
MICVFIIANTHNSSMHLHIYLTHTHIHTHTHVPEAAERKGPWTQVSMGSSRGVLRAMVAGEYDETASPAAKANPTEQVCSVMRCSVVCV